jgi:hypothetical protein
MKVAIDCLRFEALFLLRVEPFAFTEFGDERCFAASDGLNNEGDDAKEGIVFFPSRFIKQLRSEKGLKEESEIEPQAN